MITADLNALPLFDGWSDDDPTLRMRVNFPLYGVHGAAASATVLFELAPGDHVGRHTDSAEEVIVVLEGTVEATLADERGRLEAGQIALIPEMVVHDVRNVGGRTAKVLGFFAAPMVESTFDAVVQPENTRDLGTPPAEAYAEMTATAE